MRGGVMLKPRRQLNRSFLRKQKVGDPVCAGAGAPAFLAQSEPHCDLLSVYILYNLHILFFFPGLPGKAAKMSLFFKPFPTMHTKTQEHPLLRQYFIVVVICSVVVDCSVENAAAGNIFS